MNDHNTLDASGQRRRPHSDQWYRLLTEGHAPLVRARRVFRYLPSAPRCKMCNNPFGGPVGRIFGVAGFKPSRKNPNLCTRCCDAVPHGGAEVDIAVLFADVRGSTALGERTRPRTSPRCSTGSTRQRHRRSCGATPSSTNSSAMR